MKTLKERADELLRIIDGWKVDTYLNDWGTGVAELVNEANEDFSIYDEDTQAAINAIPQLIKDLVARNAELEAQRGWKPIAEMPEELKFASPTRILVGYRRERAGKVYFSTYFAYFECDFCCKNAQGKTMICGHGEWQLKRVSRDISFDDMTHYMQIPEVDDAV